jgi:hypothetical protein
MYSILGSYTQHSRVMLCMYFFCNLLLLYLSYLGALQVREARKEVEKYGGEISGIKIGVVKSIKLK